LVLAGVCLLAIAPFFYWGSPSGHDFEFHMFSWMEVLGQWKHGILYPRWSALAHFGYGEARFLFYPPASWTLGAALGAILPWAMVPGAYCWIVLTLAGAAMYRLAREWLRPTDALFAAVFYAVNPYHLLVIYWRSAYAELLAAPLLPLALLYLLQLQEPASASAVLSSSAEDNLAQSISHRLRPTLWLSLTLAATWLTNAPAAVMIEYSTTGLALLLAAREFANKRSWDPQIWRPLVRTALAILMGAGLASFYLIPATFEQGWISLNQVLAPGVRPQDNFLFTILNDADHNRFNILLSTVALAEIIILVFGIWFSRRSPAKADNLSIWPLLSFWGAASVVFMLPVSNVFWHHLPKFQFVQLPFRWLLCMNAALAMLLALATKRWSVRVLTSALLLAVLVIAGYRIQPPWWDTADDIHEMSDALADGTGYEGTDEYVPHGADAYELNKNLPRLSNDAGAPVQGEMLAWGPVEKHFKVSASTPQDLTVRLFNYPAWDVFVNGKLTETESSDVTELMIIPIGAGDNDIHIHFRRTLDRFVGNIVSLISLVVFIVVWVRLVRIKARQPDRRMTRLASPAA
jgi:hypothetical protein